MSGVFLSVSASAGGCSFDTIGISRTRRLAGVSRSSCVAPASWMRLPCRIARGPTSCPELKPGLLLVSRLFGSLCCFEGGVETGGATVGSLALVLLVDSKMGVELRLLDGS